MSDSSKGDDCQLLVGFMAVSIITGTAAGIMQLLLPLYALSLKVSDGGVGMLRGIAQVGGLLTTLPGGFLIDRFGVRRTYITCCLCNMLAIVMIPTAGSIQVLTCYLLIESSFGTLRWTAVNTAFFERLDSFGHEKAAWIRGSIAIGLNFLGPLLGGQLVQLMSFRFNYWLTGLMVLLPGLFLPLYRGVNSRRPDQVPTETPLPLSLQIRELVGNRLLLRTALLQSVAISINSGYLLYIVLLAVKVLHGPPCFAALLMASQGIAFVLVMFCGGGLLARVSLARLYGAAYLLQALGLLTAGVPVAPCGVVVGALGMGAGTGLITMVSFSRLGRMAGQKGKIAGLFFLITGTGVALGPLWAGGLANLFGIRAAFNGMVPAELVAFLYVTLLSPELASLTAGLHSSRLSAQVEVP